MMQMQDRKPSLFSQSGSFFLVGAVAILIGKSAHAFWPLLLAVTIGYAACLVWKKRGLYFSYAALLAAAAVSIVRGADPFWSSLLSASVGVSWFLIFLGNQEIAHDFEKSEEKAATLGERCQSLEKQLQGALRERSEGNRLYVETTQTLSRTQSSLEVSEKEREQFYQKCQELAQDLLEYRRKEAAHQRSLEEAQAEILQLKNAMKTEPSIIPQEESDPEEKMQISQVQCQLALLREQFEEKSATLDQTRKELFQMENAFLALQKAQEEHALEASEEDLEMMKELNALEGQCCDLEAEVQHLQKLITLLLTPKKRVVRSRKIKSKGDLPDLIQEKMDQVNFDTVKTS